MAQLSRTKKYQELRNRLQSEPASDSLSTTDLSRFEKRLNQIDSQNFSLPESYMSDDHTATHARSHEIKDEKVENPNVEIPTFDTTSYYTNSNDATFDNDYLDQYIREVKQYNIDQGNAAVENTQLNILAQIERNNSDTPVRPYSRKSNKLDKDATADIPFASAFKQKSKQTEVETSNEDKEASFPTQMLSKEDIMAEVQNLVNGEQTPEITSKPKEEVKPSYPFVEDDVKFDKNMSTDTFNRKLEIDRTTRQQLLNETTQMRAQLDDYEDNLSEVSDKMRQTNKILNIVLVILILFLTVIVGFVIYWIIISK